MKRLLLMVILVFVGAAGWQLGEKLSADALSMAIGIFFGVLASVPAALLVLAASRRGERMPRDERRASQPGYGGQGFQSPVIVVAPPMHGFGPAQVSQGQAPPYPQGYLPAAQQIVEAPRQRQFKVVGEEEEWVEEF